MKKIIRRVQNISERQRPATTPAPLTLLKELRKLGGLRAWEMHAHRLRFAEAVVLETRD